MTLLGGYISCFVLPESGLRIKRCWCCGEQILLMSHVWDKTWGGVCRFDGLVLDSFDE
ncbi:MAG: hypothetical protein GY853_13170 [PVC group bacterium]|nr:hypothetical protein [PVC group bacterium]